MHLYGIQQTQLATVRMAKVILPAVKRLERVHQRTIEAIARRRDEPKLTKSVLFDILAFQVHNTHNNVSQAFRTMSRLLLYHFRLGSRN